MIIRYLNNHTAGTRAIKLQAYLATQKSEQAEMFYAWYKNGVIMENTKVEFLVYFVCARFAHIFLCVLGGGIHSIIYISVLGWGTDVCWQW